MTPKLLAILGLTAWMTLCDRFFHVATNTVVHFWSPFMGDQTVWVLACFGLGATGIVLTAPKFAVDSPRPLRFLAEVAIMTAVYATSGFLGAAHATPVTAAFAGLFFIRFAASSDRGTIALVALILAVTGPAFESLQWHLGMFKYTQPDVFGVPWWLIPFYANGAWAICELGALLTPGRHPASSRSPGSEAASQL